MTKRLFCGLIFVMALTMLNGCGRNVALSGRVTFSDDGSPVPCGTVIFDNGKDMGKGAIQEDGSYVVGFEKRQNGIPRGEYRIRIVGAVKEVGQSETTEDKFSGQKLEQMGSQKTVDLIDRKYRTLGDSGLTLTVDGSTATFDIKVDRFKGK